MSITNKQGEVGIVGRGVRTRNGVILIRFHSFVDVITHMFSRITRARGYLEVYGRGDRLAFWQTVVKVHRWWR